MASENGWEPSHAGADILEWILVPDTNVHLQVMKGWPSAVMKAYAADYNAFVEPLRDSDSASFTPTNSVATSNHLNGTAMDLNWDSHPFRVSNAGYSPQMIATMREILAFYTYKGVQVMWWAQDWDSPKDAMHHQMGYDTWNNPVTGEFIAKCIRADGFSTFRRGGSADPGPLPPIVVSKADGYAIKIIQEGARRGVTPRGQQIALSVALVESGMQEYANSNVPESMNIPHDKVGTDHDSVGLFQQRCPMWGPAAVLMDPTLSAGLFYDRLVKLDYNNTSRLPGDYAADVQRPAAQYRGRYQERMGDAVALYNRLANSPVGDDDDMIPPNEWAEVLAAARRLTSKQPTRSPVRPLDEKPVEADAVDFGLWTNGGSDFKDKLELAKLGHQPTLDLLNRNAANADPSLQYEASIARNIIAAAKRAWAAPASTAVPAPAVEAVTVDNSVALAAQVAQLQAENTQVRAENADLKLAVMRAQTVAIPEPASVPAVPESKTAGDHAGQLIDSVKDWTDVAYSLDATGRNALQASLQVLALKNANGSEPS